MPLRWDMYWQPHMSVPWGVPDIVRTMQRCQP